MATQRILDFLATRRPNGPCLVVDLDVVRDNFHAFEKALPDSRIFYAVKANPAPEILRLLATLGSSFDTASVTEVEMALDAGASADRISFGNTIKKERDIARAHELGINLFTVDCVEEVEKIARSAPRARVFCRVLTDGEGAEWPLSRKFGCAPKMAVDVLAHAARRAAGFPRAFTLWQVFNIAVSLLSLAILFASDVFVVTGWSLAPPLAEIAAGSALILLVSRSKEAPLVFYDEGTTEPPGLVVAVNAILGAILGGIGGLVIGFAVGAMLVEILDVSCFEGGCGYFAAAIGLLGMLLGAVAGAVVAVWRTRRRGRTARAAT